MPLAIRTWALLVVSALCIQSTSAIAQDGPSPNGRVDGSADPLPENDAAEPVANNDATGSIANTNAEEATPPAAPPSSETVAPEQPPEAEDRLGIVEQGAPLAAIPSPTSIARGQSRQADDRLELALARSAQRFDAVTFLSAQRSFLVAVFEGYCAINLMLRRNTRDVLLGAGCLLGALTTGIMAYRQFAHPAAVADNESRLERFRLARRHGAPDRRDRYLLELRDRARRDRRRRIFGGVFGALNIVATVVISALTARDTIERSTGVSIASGTAMLGLLGVVDIFVRSPAEQALELYELDS